MSKDSYHERFHVGGNAVSRLMATTAAQTLRDAPSLESIVSGKNGITVARLAPGETVVAVSALGDGVSPFVPSTTSRAIVDTLYTSLNALGATPVGFSNIMNYSSAEGMDDIREYAHAMAAAATERRVGMMNGESALLTFRLAAPIAGAATGIGISSNTVKCSDDAFSYTNETDAPQLLYLNSDGVGTKGLYAELLHAQRASNNGDSIAVLARPQQDMIAMTADDTVKLGARLLAIMGQQEATNALYQRSEFASTYRATLASLGIKGSLLTHLSSSISEYIEDIPASQIDGTAISVVDEARLQNLPVPREGDVLLGIRTSDLRSNGFTGYTEGFARAFENRNWYTFLSDDILDYLSRPSAVFYPAFSELLDKAFASSVFHMSGGALDGKLAAPLAKHGLFVDMGKLPLPDTVPLLLQNLTGTASEFAYRKWGMNMNGYVTVSPDSISDARRVLERHGFDDVFELGSLESNAGTVGVSFVSHDDTRIAYTGKE